MAPTFNDDTLLYGHLLGHVLGFSHDSPPATALRHAGIETFSDFLCLPRDFDSFREEITYEDVLPSEEIATMELHPTYVGLLVVFRAFLSAKLQSVYADEHLQPFDVLSGLTRKDFIVFLHGYEEYSDISFPVVGVLPGKVLEIHRPRPTPPTVQHLPQQVLCPGPTSTGIYTGRDSQSTHLDVPCTTASSNPPSVEETVLPASPDTSPSLVLGVASPTCSSVLAESPPLDILELGPTIEEPSPTSQGITPDIFRSLVFDTVSPSCSLVFSGLRPVLLDFSPLLPVVLSEKTGCSPLDRTAPPDNLNCSPDNSLAPSSTSVWPLDKGESIGSHPGHGPPVEVFTGPMLRFLSPSLLPSSPSLVLALGSPGMSDPSPSSTSELPSDQGEESTGSLFGHELPAGVSAGPTPVLPTSATRLRQAPWTPTECRTPPSLVLVPNGAVESTPSPRSISVLPTGIGESIGSRSRHGPPVGVFTGPMVTPVQPILSVQGRPAVTASARARVFAGPVVTMIQPILTVRGRPAPSASTKSSTTPYWAVGPSASALLPVPRLIAVRAVLWVINTLHDPRRVPTACQHPVPCPTARVRSTVIGELYAPAICVYDYGPCSRAISARLLMYSWARGTLQHSTVTGELYVPTLCENDNGPCSRAMSARLPVYSSAHGPLPCLPSATAIGEPYMPPVDNRPVYAYCSTPCTYAYYVIYCPCSRHSVVYSTHAPSSHTHGFHTLHGNPTRIAYTVVACRPLRPALGLHDSILRTRVRVYAAGSHQRGVTRITQVLGLILCVIVVGAPGRIVCPSSVRSWSGLGQLPTHRPSFSPDSRRNRPFPHVSHVGSTWKLHSHRNLPYVGRRHRHADGRSSDGLRHWHTRCRWILPCPRHRRAVRWKHRTASTIVVLSLRRLGKEFPSSTYHSYHGTVAYSSHRSSRLIAVWWLPWYPKPCRHRTAGTMPSVIACRRRHKYQEPVANGKRTFLANPGNDLHVGMISLCSSIGTMIRSPGQSVSQTGVWLPILGHSEISLAFR